MTRATLTTALIERTVKAAARVDPSAVVEVHRDRIIIRLAPAPESPPNAREGVQTCDELFGDGSG